MIFSDITFVLLEEVDSTNLYAKLHSHLMQDNVILAIIAREQTSGKGRYDKKWISKKDESITMSFLFPLKNYQHPAHLTQILAYSAAELFNEMKLGIKIKWPNDLFVENRKMGGILMETVNDSIILGIGLNINQTVDDLENIDQPSTSFFIETTHNLYVEEAAKVLAKIFLGNLNKLLNSGFAFFKNQINEHFLIKKSALWSNDVHIKQGIILGIDDYGCLIFEEENKKNTYSYGSLNINF